MCAFIRAESSTTARLARGLYAANGQVCCCWQENTYHLQQVRLFKARACVYIEFALMLITATTNAGLGSLGDGDYPTCCLLEIQGIGSQSECQHIIHFI